MLRSDTTALFERLREANILLQEVLSGAHDNMSEIESTLVTRVADFVAAMNQVSQQAGSTNHTVEQHIANFRQASAQTLAELGQLAAQFDTHGRSLAEAVSLIDRSNRRTEGALNERRESLETLAAMLDTRAGELDNRLARFSHQLDQSMTAVTRGIEMKADDLEQRLSRFSGVLDQTLESAGDRTREIARLVADSTTSGTRAIADNFEAIRSSNEDEYKHTLEAMRAVYDQATGDAQALFGQAAQRFADVLQGLKQMAAEMQHELDSTRAELRKGILELPAETAESAAQMRRVIVDQIEALAELNRIVARHGRNLDTVEPSARRADAAEPTPPRREPILANGNSPRAEPPRPRADMMGLAPATPPAPPPPPPLPSSRRSDSPSLSPAAATPPARGGWLSDLLTRASQDDQSARETSGREPPPEAARSDRHTIESLDSIAVDIARMIDHDAAAELWDRYKRGERNVFTRKLYTMQGQRAFEEIRRKYRSDREFMKTVDRYIAEFERLLDEVSRDDRGQMMSRTYLTSETGKVYTMLAHAAGRFDQ
jgi:ABC-type transporter Mla subunit MlaD